MGNVLEMPGLYVEITVLYHSKDQCKKIVIMLPFEGVGELSGAVEARLKEIGLDSDVL